MSIDATAALIFAPFVWPICFYVAWSDLSAMKIFNASVLALAAVFVVVGPFALPFDTYLWRLATMIGVLVVTFVLNAAGAMGAGDSKFIAAAAPFIDPGDVVPLMLVFAACLLGAFTAHRLARMSRLREWAPDWESWTRKGDFPMGFPLAAALAAYLGLGIFWGA